MVLWHLGCVYLFKLVFSTQEWGGSYGNYTFSFLRNLHTVFPQWLHQFVFAPTVYEGSLFSTSSPTFVICALFDDRYEVISHYDFDLHFSDDKWCWASFHVLVGRRCVLFWKMSVQVFRPIFNQFLFFSCWVVWAVYIFWMSWHTVCKYFLPFSRWSFVNGFLCCVKAFKFN